LIEQAFLGDLSPDKVRFASRAAACQGEPKSWTAAVEGEVATVAVADFEADLDQVARGFADELLGADDSFIVAVIGCVLLCL